MRLPFVKQTMLAGICVFVSSCSYNQEGASLPNQARPAGAAPATPPSVFSNQSSIPSASSFYPTGHSASSSSSSSSKQALSVTPNPPSSVVNSSNAPGAVSSSANTLSSSSSASDKADADTDFDGLDVIDPNLKGKLGILRVGSEPTSNNLLSVFAGLKNKTAHPLALEVQTIYKDKMGSSLNDGSWVAMTLKPHEETEYRSSSISAEAVDFLVRVRGASADGAAGTN